ncbi:C45 family peptidase [Oscillospiraceae bacterium PP1C4]
MNTQVHHILLEGSNYEVGRNLGNICKKIPGLPDVLRTKEAFITKQDETKMYQLFDEFCPGINEEIIGLADELGIPAIQVLYYAMTYLRPGCSQLAVLPSKTKNGHTLIARTYDFSDRVDDMTLATTKIKNKYAHIGSSIMQFGRGDGMNEHGLTVSQTSAGLPVGNFEFAAKPAIVGLQFWAVIRSVLENCKDVDEAIQWTRNMPIAYNINMLVADKNGCAALIETFNGMKAVKRIDAQSDEQFICSTNHVHLPELKVYAPKSMNNSVKRYNLIRDILGSMEQITPDNLKNLISTKYPEGLCCHFYDEFFGNLRSMIFDVTMGTMDICFGSPANNKWYRLKVNDEIQQTEYPVIIAREKAPEDFYTMVDDF